MNQNPSNTEKDAGQAPSSPGGRSVALVTQASDDVTQGKVGAEISTDNSTNQGAPVLDVASRSSDNQSTISGLTKDSSIASKRSSATAASESTGGGSGFQHMIVGPLLEDVNNNRRNQLTLGEHLSQLYTQTGFAAPNADLDNFGTSVDLRYELNGITHSTGLTSQTHDAYQTRTSVGAAAFRTVVEYRDDFGRYVTAFKMTDDTEAEKLAILISNLYSGTEAGVAAGPGDRAYSQAVTKVKARDVVAQHGLSKERGVSVFKVWTKVWQNMDLLMLSQETPLAANNTRWAQRPNNPADIHIEIAAFNVYNEYDPNIKAGRCLVVEIKPEEYRYIGYINFLLGGTPACFDYDYGNDGAGHDIEPHQASVTTVPFEYRYLIRNDNGGAVLPPIMNIAVMGLPAAPAAPIAVVQDINWNHMEEALRVISRSCPIKGDCEAAWWLSGMANFAENFRGVDLNNYTSGDGQPGRGWNAMLHEGPIPVPSGDFSCCMFTKLTEGSPKVTQTQELAIRLGRMSRAVLVRRRTVEALVLTIQLAARQIGVTTPISFARLNWANMHINGIPTPMDDISRRLHQQRVLCHSNAQNSASAIMNCADAICGKIYGVKLPGPLLVIQYGHRMAGGRQCPTHGHTNMGECLTSVHPAQLPVGIIKSPAIGMAGMPFNVGFAMKELRFKHRVNGFEAIGHQNTSVLNEGTSMETLIGNPGVAMLGHTVHLRRDAMQVNDNAYRVSVATIMASRCTQSVGESVPHERVRYYGLSPDALFTNCAELYETHWELYSDFDYLTGADLTLIVPETARGRSIATSSKTKEVLTEYVGASLEIDELTGRESNIMVVHIPKRHKVTD